jgi:peptide/nickel transport system ATP-binding protein
MAGGKWQVAHSPSAKRQAPPASEQGCKFADRCPHVMPVCGEHPPPFFQTDPQRVAACYLYQDASTLTGQEMVQVFA